MHDVEVTDAVHAPRPRRRNRRAFDPSPFGKLFRRFRLLRAASPGALDELFLKRAFPNQSSRNMRRMVATLVDEGYLAKLRLPNARLVYHLTRRSLATLEQAGIDAPETLRRPPTIEVGGMLWMLSELRAEHVRQGFEIGRGPPASFALRRALLAGPLTDPRVLDAVRANAALNPPMADGCTRCGFRAASGARCLVCPRCNTATRPRPLDAKFECTVCQAVAAEPGPHNGCEHLMREVDCLPADVAWRKVGARYEVRLLFVEHPSRTLGAQLAELPLFHVGAPKVPVVLRSTDPDSRYDRKSRAWAVKGPRHQQLERTFLENGFDAKLPFSMTTTLVDVLPDLQLYIMRSGEAPPAWECAAAWNGGRAKLAGRNKKERDPRLQELEDPRLRAHGGPIRSDEEVARPLDFVAMRAAAAHAEREIALEQRAVAREAERAVAPVAERVIARDVDRVAREAERAATREPRRDQNAHAPIAREHSGGFARRR
jgi:hypothetical protein